MQLHNHQVPEKVRYIELGLFIAYFRSTTSPKKIHREWDAIRKKLLQVLRSLTSEYPKGSFPPTLEPTFLADATKLANKFLVTKNTDSGYVDFSRRLTICKESNVNEVLLNYATTIAIFKRTDMPNFVPNPTQTPKATAVFRGSEMKPKALS